MHFYLVIWLHWNGNGDGNTWGQTKWGWGGDGHRPDGNEVGMGADLMGWGGWGQNKWGWGGNGNRPDGDEVGMGTEDNGDGVGM